MIQLRGCITWLTHEPHAKVWRYPTLSVAMHHDGLPLHARDPPWLLQSAVVVEAKAGEVKLEWTANLTWDGCRPANNTFPRQRHADTTIGV